MENHYNAAFTVFARAGIKLQENVQQYSPYIAEFRPNYLVSYLKSNVVVAFWTDVVKISPFSLKKLFENHKDVPFKFFIQQVAGGWRIGWKV